MGRRAVLWAGSRSAEEASPSPVYGAALLMRFGFTPIRGSNPRASATLTRDFAPKGVESLFRLSDHSGPLMVPLMVPAVLRSALQLHGAWRRHADAAHRALVRPVPA